MKHVHYAVRVIEEKLYVIVIAYAEDADEIISITRLTVHPVNINGIIGENVIDDPDTITEKMYVDAIIFLEEDGCIDGGYVDDGLTSKD